jgi:hypothetical protein
MRQWQVHFVGTHYRYALQLYKAIFLSNQN